MCVCVCRKKTRGVWKGQCLVGFGIVISLLTGGPTHNGTVISPLPLSLSLSTHTHTHTHTQRERERKREREREREEKPGLTKGASR